MTTGFLGSFFVAAMTLSAPLAWADAPPALQGQVTSTEEGPMEGVVISASQAGSTITISVVTDDKGHYAFPAARLSPGHYTLAIRAAGYELAAPQSADVSKGQSATAALALKKTKRLSAQLTDAEWMMSAPGTDAQRQFLSNCVDCHTVQRIFQSTHDAAEFQQLFVRMSGYSPGSVPTHPQPTVGGPQRPFGTKEQMQPYADWLASINLSETESWDYPLKTLPRVRGPGTRVIITEYALPRADAEPHDVIMDKDGMVWYSDFGQQFIGMLDPATGKVTDYPLPMVKPGFPTGTLDLEPDPDGNIWVSMMYQTGVARLDLATKTLKTFPLPKEWQANHTQESMVSPTFDKVDGKVWTNNQDMHAFYRLDPQTGQYENVGVRKDAEGRGINAYGMPADHQNGLYLMNFGGAEIGHLDAKSLNLVIYPTPTPHSRPRRGRVDANGDLWFAEYNGNAIGKFDPKTEKITEYKLPTPFSDPYDVVPDKDGDVWAASMLTDRVDRLDPKTGNVIEYPLPRDTNIRRVFVDNRSEPPTLWVGNNHGAAIVKVEPLE
jgi:virginiamycin B lyase